MEPKLLFSSSSASLSTSLPFFLSQKSFYFLERPKLSGRTHLSVSPFQLGNSQFLGNSLYFEEKNVSFSGKFRKTHLPFEPVRAAGVKWRKERPFDNVIDRDKKLKLVMKIRKILVNQPNRILSLRELGKFRRELGLTKKRRLIALLKKFPAVFEIVEEGVYSLQFRMTPEAERLYLEELKVRNEMEDLLVLKLRKLLMMSIEKRILLEKIAHLKTDFGLPFEFRDTICHRYPQYFRVVATGRGPALELTNWDPELAVSAAELAEEENRAKKLQEKDLIIDRPLKFNRVKLPKGLQLSKSEMRRICQFRDIPYISPYSDFSHLRSGSKEKEKHACGVVHEILSLTAEKRTLVDHLTHFREEFRFSQQLRGMLIRHPDLFYVSLKGDRDSVFLREAYCDSHLVEKDRLLLIKEKLRSLVTVPRFPRRGSVKTDSVGGEDGTSGQEDGIVEKAQDWSDIDSYLSGDESNDDEDDGYEDDWSDEDDDMPPDFDDDGTVRIRLSKSINQLDTVTNDKGKVLTPVFPDGRPRELCIATVRVSFLGGEHRFHKVLVAVVVIYLVAVVVIFRTVIEPSCQFLGITGLPLSEQGQQIINEALRRRSLFTSPQGFQRSKLVRTFNQGSLQLTKIYIFASPTVILLKSHAQQTSSYAPKKSFRPLQGSAVVLVCRSSGAVD
ncbi:hypothetical protein SADUNF_Sadunf02G0141800 [Salix dunnii]|uniref:PORR domain-containing protein n=1 Tax=Salix dunnii TaxID=1413687 RepID=A0A835N7Y0_9ROSI|nr:hypothetical protein SADUNF_Sadunf02G0141800 [Salix dunnii]